VSLEHAILGVLSFAPNNGYGIKHEFEHGMGLVWKASFGSIYPKLSELEKKGYITTEDLDDARGAKVHELTAEGWKELDTWLGITPSYPIPMADELLLKTGFWGVGRPGDRQTLIHHLEGRKIQSRELLKDLREWPHNGTSAIDEYAMFVIEYLVGLLEMELEWIERTIEQLEKPQRPPVQDPQNLYGKARERRDSALRGSS